jgi:hypothetical protein
MKKYLLSAIALVLLTASCKEANQTVKIDNRYSLELPPFLEKATDLHAEASLQYKNELREFYVIVIDEPIAEFNAALGADNELGATGSLDGYAKLGVAFMQQSAKFDAAPNLVPAKINGFPAKTLNVTGKINNIDIYWKEAYIQGKNTYYQVIVWTLANKKEAHENEMQEVINSFKEYDKGRK